jgi:predicted exporter
MRARRGLTTLRAWLTSHLAVTLVLSGAILAGGLALASRMTVEQDIGAMLPDGPGSPREAARLLEEFGVLNVLLLDLEIPGASPTELSRAGNDLATRLRSSGAFSEVLTGPTTEEILAVGRVLFPRRLYLLDDPASAIEGRLAPSKLQASLTGLKAKLAAPQAIVTKGDVLRDPLGLNDELLASLSGAASVQSQGGQLLSPDQTHLLLVTVPRASALDTDASAALLARVEGEGARLPAGAGGPARLRAVGGPRFAAESAATVKHDVVVTMFTSLAALVAIFVVRFRSLRLLVVAFVTLAFGVVGGLVAVALVYGRIHALTFAFGSVLIGIAIDYPMYLLNAASVQAGTPLQRMSAGLEESRRSLWLGFLTTLIAFALMLFSKFPGLRELALFAGAGIAVAFAATLILVVPIGARWGLQHLSAIPSWMLALGAVRPPPALAWGIVVAVIAVAAVSIPKLQFEGELRHLDAQRPATLAEYEEVRKRFGLQGTDSLVVARGATAEDALRLSDQVARTLLQAQRCGDVSHVVSLSSFLPSLQSQTARRSRLADLDVTAARATLTRVSGQLGFSEGAFDPFWRELESVRSGEIPPVQPEDLAHTSLGALVRRLLRCSGSGCIAVTSFEPSRLSAVAELRRELPRETVVIDGGALAADTVAQIPRQLALLSGVGLLLNLLLLAFAYRSTGVALLACLPGALGLLGTLAILPLLHIPLNLVSASALVLILGCGVDYGIFAVQGVTRAARDSGVEFTGVLLTSSTTLAGVGTLALASYRAIQSLGVAVGLGIGISAVVALFVIPSLWSGTRAREAAPA